MPYLYIVIKDKNEGEFQGRGTMATSIHEGMYGI